MATITSAQSGLASAPSTWVGGVVPVEGDKVIIALGHVVTLDSDYTWGDDSVTETLNNAAINVNGTLRASRTVNSSLTGRGLILLGQANTTGIDFGTQADPLPANITAQLILNKATTPATRYGLRQLVTSTAAGQGANIYMWSANQRLYSSPLLATVNAGANTIQVATGHNWQVGDSLMFVTTTDNTTQNQCEFRAITAISGTTITLNSNLTFTHLSGSPAANVTRNIVVRSFNEVSGQTARVYISAPANSLSNFNFIFNGVEFRNIGSPFLGMIESIANTIQGVLVGRFTNCSFVNQLFTINCFTSMWTQFPTFTNNVFYLNQGFLAQNGTPAILTNSVVAAFGMLVGQFKHMVENVWFTGIGVGGSTSSPFVSAGTTYKNVTVSGYMATIAKGALASVMSNCDLGFTYGLKMASNEGSVMQPSLAGYTDVTLKDCLLHPMLLSPSSDNNLNPTSPSFTGASIFNKVVYENKGKDRASQEIWLGTGVTYRDNAVRKNGASSIRIHARQIGVACTKSQEVIVLAGQSFRIVGNVRLDSNFVNAGDAIAPTVTLAMNGNTQTFTATLTPDVWQPYSFNITNSTGSDATAILTYSATAKTVATGMVYFDGVPDFPFINKVRHYGFNFDEAQVNRVVNKYIKATENVANAYTGVTINPSTKRISFGAGTANTLDKFYDYSQAWLIANIDQPIVLVRAGQMLTMIDGWTIVDPNYNDAVWSNATIELTVAKAYLAGFDTATLDFKTTGAYDFGDASLSGTITLNNSSAGNITVVLPAGVTYVNNTPSTLTVTEKTNQAQAQITGLVAGSRVQIFNETTNTEIFNDIVSGTSYSTNYVDGTGYIAGDVVRVRIAYQSGVTAKVPVQYKAVATANGWSVLASQVDDAVYNTNAIDGSTVTEFIQDTNSVQIDISDPDGITNVQRGYAWYIAGQMTANGIRYFHGGITAEDTVNYRVNVDVVNIKLENISAIPVYVLGGRIYRSDNQTILATTGYSIQMEYGRAYAVSVSGGGTGGATASEIWSHPSRTLTQAIPTSAQVADAVWAKELP